MSCLKTLCNSSRFVSFSSLHFFFNAFESCHLKLLVSELSPLCVHTQMRRKAGYCEPTLLFGMRDKAPEKAATPPWNLRRHATQKCPTCNPEAPGARLLGMLLYYLHVETKIQKKKKNPLRWEKIGYINTMNKLTNHHESMKAKQTWAFSKGWNLLGTGCVEMQKLTISGVCFCPFSKARTLRPLQRLLS